MPLINIYFSFRGRVGRSTYWIGSIPIYIIVAIAQVYDEHDWTILLWLAILCPVFALSTKRWHDRNKSGWWNFICFLPCIGTLWALIECGFCPMRLLHCTLPRRRHALVRGGPGGCRDAIPNCRGPS
ncbi:MAG: DUF805 domain-containing protein [Candidatus Lindowbacteria bacterium]|nr:DUF805 domain-containing protein [Candidatus Lindowbacteria bacterium]